MLVSEFLLRTQEILGDEAKTQITDAKVIKWLNSARRDVYSKAEFQLSTVAINVVLGTGFYATPFMAIEAVRLGNNILTRMSHQELPTYDMDGIPKIETLTPSAQVQIQTGIPVAFTEGIGGISLYPIPSSAAVGTNNLIVFGAGGGAIDLTTPGDNAVDLSTVGTHFVPYEFQEPMINYLLARGKELDENWTAAKYFQDRFETELDQAIGRYQQRGDQYSVIREDVDDISYNSNYPYGVVSW